MRSSEKRQWHQRNAKSNAANSDADVTHHDGGVVEVAEGLPLVPGAGVGTVPEEAEHAALEHRPVRAPPHQLGPLQRTRTPARVDTRTDCNTEHTHTHLE